MAGLRFVADMHISPVTIRELKARGLDVIRVSDVLDCRAPDSQILAFARDHGRIVVTQDLDFSFLLAIGGRTGPSLITLRLEDARPSTITRRVLEVVAALGQELSEGIAVSVDETSVRYRLLPILREHE